ncbi:MAG: hypothetical protein ACP5RY_06175 [Thermoplasmata archaeon]
MGKIVNDLVQCPFHGIEHDGSGKAVLIPSTGVKSSITTNFRVRSYSVTERSRSIFLWFGREMGRLPEIKFLDGIDSSFNFSGFEDYWWSIIKER